jgi:hypothetical protein
MNRGRKSGELLSIHKSCLSGTRRFLIFLSRIQKFVALLFTGKEPRHDRLRLGRSAIREDDRSVGATSIARLGDRMESRYESPIFAEDLNKVTIVAVRQLEPIRARRQDSPGNLDRLTELEPGRLIPIICVDYWEDGGDCEH